MFFYKIFIPINIPTPVKNRLFILVILSHVLLSRAVLNHFVLANLILGHVALC